MTSTPNLISLLPSTPYTLAYSLPLLLLSFVLTFAGTFLMLDRSRSFPPSADYTALPGAFEKNKKRKFVWFLEGGAGGLVCGYTTGCKSNLVLKMITIPKRFDSTFGHLSLPRNPNKNYFGFIVLEIFPSCMDTGVRVHDTARWSLPLCCPGHGWTFWRVSHFRASM